MTQTSSYNGLDSLVLVVKKLHELHVLPREGEGWLACRNRNFHGRFNAERLEDVSEHRVAHKLPLVIDPRKHGLGQQQFLIGTDFGQMGGKYVCVETEHRLDGTTRYHVVD